METKCFHCGQACEEEATVYDDKPFCCHGCKSVYEILKLSDLDNFYELNRNPGMQPDKKLAGKFNYLDTPAIHDSLVDFSDDGVTVVTFDIPVIHCSSCVWVLESLHQIKPGIMYSVVNFAQRRVQITYRDTELKLSELAVFLSSLGYKPVISLGSAEKKAQKHDRRLVYQLVTAGFCFGNIMLLAFPEYVNSDEQFLYDNRNFFRWLMFILSLPVVFYSSQDYLLSAWSAIKTRRVNIDVPIALGILVLFLRSTYEIIIDFSPGYFDTLAGLLFFMLIGKWFQRRTYQSLAFDRDYKSFYPISVTRIEDNTQTNILLSELKKGDRILLRDEEILPADAIVMAGTGNIDNSFVTGESRLIQKNVGDKVFAGGKQSGAAIELEVISDVNQSYLTTLWNNEAFHREISPFDSMVNRVSKYFVWVILAITLISATYWYIVDFSKVFQVITAILIIACPCALALSAPFTLGNVMRIMGRKHLYVKDARTVENMAKIDTVVFDKTGTITETAVTEVQYIGQALSAEEKMWIRSLANQSSHPLSRSIVEHLKAVPMHPATQYEQVKGKGQRGMVDGAQIELGSRKWLTNQASDAMQAEVYVRINGDLKGKFTFANKYRKGLNNVISHLQDKLLHVVSGDNEAERKALQAIFPADTELLFDHSPQNKLDFIQHLEVKEDRKVMMIGDGLNDAGALKQSLVGVAVAEDMNSFSPSCDAILESSAFGDLPKFLRLSQVAVNLVIVAFIISFLYNVIGLAFAVTANLSPVVAAILMPVSSISVVGFATASTWLAASRIFKRKEV